MLQKVEAIILRTIKYRESAVIVYTHTNLFGRKTYMLNVSQGAKSKNKISFFQPLYILDMEVYNKEKSDINRIKEFKFSEPLKSIPFDVRKSSIAMFLAEVLYKIVREEEKNEALFDFIRNSILLLDEMSAGVENFHLHFLVNLSHYLGIRPSNLQNYTQGFFDIKSGEISAIQPKHFLFFDKENTQILQTLLETQSADIDKIKLNGVQRERFLSSMLNFYSYHFENFGTINSLKIFKEIFSV